MNGLIPDGQEYDESMLSTKNKASSGPARMGPLGNWPLVKEALLSYHRIYGHYNIPCQFVIPSMSLDWPESVWDLKLGTIVRDMRSKDSYRDQRGELEDMGFDFQTTRDRQYEVTKIALNTYMHLMGDMDVPVLFRVPENDLSWPEITWGLKLGNIAAHIRSLERFKKHRDELMKMGFPFHSKSKKVGWHKLCIALLRYKEIHGNLLVPFTYVIPSKSTDWPKNTWGMKLGFQVGGIRCQNYYKEHHAELAAMGFVFQVRRKRNSVKSNNKFVDSLEGGMNTMR